MMKTSHALFLRSTGEGTAQNCFVFSLKGNYGEKLHANFPKPFYVGLDHKVGYSVPAFPMLAAKYCATTEDLMGLWGKGMVHVLKKVQEM